MLKALTCLLLALALPAQALDITDDAGHVTTLAAPAQRIVSLLPSLTETVCELGACARLVGVDRYSNFPASVNGLPKLGGLDDTNVEMIAALKPDVVLLAMSSRVSERLRGLGLKVIALEPRSYKDVQRVLGNYLVYRARLGGAAISDSPDNGVIDPYQRVFDYPTLHVMDGAAVSANLGVNPSLSITAQAERATSLWPNKDQADPRPAQGEDYLRLDPVVPGRPVVPAEAPGALRRIPIEPINTGG